MIFKSNTFKVSRRLSVVTVDYIEISNFILIEIHTLED